MSTPVPPSSAPRTIPCPRCNATIGPEQDWCLNCGAPARTRLAPLPNWRLPVALVGILAIGAIVALILAFVSLTSDDSTITPTTAVTAPVTTAVGAPVGPTATVTAPVTTAVTTPVITTAVTTPTVTTATTTPTTATTTPPGGVTSPAG